jgi:phosphoglycolate phosphatase
MKYKYILFDLDGTLVDSREGITDAYQYAFAAMNTKVPSLEEVKPAIGLGLKNGFMHFFDQCEKQADLAIAHFQDRYKERGILLNTVFPGVEQTLHNLNSNEMSVSIATMKVQENAERVIESLGMNHFFDFINGTQVTAKVSKKDVIANALKRLDVPEEEKHLVIMVGDTVHDITGAHDNGIESIAVSFGYGDDQEIKAENPKHICHSFEEVEKALLG